MEFIYHWIYFENHRFEFNSSELPSLDSIKKKLDIKYLFSGSQIQTSNSQAPD